MKPMRWTAILTALALMALLAGCSGAPGTVVTGARAGGRPPVAAQPPPEPTRAATAQPEPIAHPELAAAPEPADTSELRPVSEQAAASRPTAPPQPAPATDPAGRSESTAQLAPPAPVTARYVVVAEQSRASYQVGWHFLNQHEQHTAVGTTSDMAGEIVFGPQGLRPSTITVDLNTLRSEFLARDRCAQKTLNTGEYPLAQFIIATASGEAAFAGGQVSRFALRGTLRLAGRERPLTWNVVGTVADDHLQWTAAAEFALTDFGIEPPGVDRILQAADPVRLEVQLVAIRVAE